MTNQERTAAIAELQALIDIGLASGICAKSADEIFAELASVYDAMNSSPSKAVPADAVFDGLRTDNDHK